MAQPEDHFTVFIRLPFARGDFIDPPPVAWSAAKERELWEVLSKSSKGHEIDWKELSHRLEATEAFLLQQAAWLYERQLSQVRAQMRRMGTRASNTASPMPQSNTASQVGAQSMKRTGSGGSRVPSRLSTQIAVSNDGSTPGTPLRPRSSFTSRPAQPVKEQKDTGSRPLSRRTSKDSEIISRTHSRRGSVQHTLTRSPKQDVVHEVESSSEEEMTQSRMLLHRKPNPAASRRGPAARKAQHIRQPSAPQLDEEDEDDDDGSPAFLPYSNNLSETTKTDNTIRDPVTIEEASSRPQPDLRTTSEHVGPQKSPAGDITSSASSNSEAQPDRARLATQSTGRNNLPQPLSPVQQAALATRAGLSPRLRRNIGGHGSESSPSMGSSFSDLDDASVTQSALEEALLSMGNTTMTVGGPTGTVANRISGISRALNSRYFDARPGESQR